MSYFVPQTMTVNIDDENSVTIRRLTFGQRQSIMSKALAGADNNMVVVQFTMQAELLKVAIQSWDGPEFDGRPVNAENIALLPSHLADKILDEADDFLKGITETEKKASGEDGNSP